MENITGKDTADIFEKSNDDAEQVFKQGGTTLESEWNRGTFHGIHKQKQENLYYAGFNVPEGAMDADELIQFANFADEVGNGEIRTTNSQNILIINIPENKISAVKESSLAKKFSLNPGAFSGYCSACTGNQYCNFAPIETKHRLQHIVEELDKAFPEITEPFRVNLTGCVHACAHPNLAEIGMTGARAKVDGVAADAVTFVVGGQLGKNYCFGKKLNGRVADKNILPAIKEIISHYLSNRAEKESFNDFVKRTGTEDFQNIVNRYLVE